MQSRETGGASRTDVGHGQSTESRYSEVHRVYTHLTRRSRDKHPRPPESRPGTFICRIWVLVRRLSVAPIVPYGVLSTMRTSLLRTYNADVLLGNYSYCTVRDRAWCQGGGCAFLLRVTHSLYSVDMNPTGHEVRDGFSGGFVLEGGGHSINTPWHVVQVLIPWGPTRTLDSGLCPVVLSIATFGGIHVSRATRERGSMLPTVPVARSSFCFLNFVPRKKESLKYYKNQKPPQLGKHTTTGVSEIGVCAPLQALCKHTNPVAGKQH